MSDFMHAIRVGWGDCDPARIAYTARIPAWALEAIDAWWEHHLDGDGWFQMETDRNVGTPFVHMDLDFTAPITPRHRLHCAVRPMKLGKKSVTFQVKGTQNGTLCFTGQFVSVFTVADSFTPQVAPPEIRAVVEPHLAPDDKAV